MDMQNSISAEADQHATRAREQREQADADEKTKRETVRADKPEAYFLYHDDRMEAAYNSATDALAGLKAEPKNDRQRVYISDGFGNSYAEKKTGERLGEQGYGVPTWGIETSPEFKQDLAQEEAIRERETISEERPSVEREGQELAQQREFEEKLGKWETELIGHDEGHQGLKNLARQEVRQEQEFEEREQAYEPDMSQEQEDAARDRQEATAHKRPENAFAELRAAMEKFHAVKDQMQKHDPKGWEAKLDAAIKASPNPVMPQRQAWEAMLEKTNTAPSPVIAQELAPWQKQLAAEAQPPTQEAERQAQMQRQQEIDTPGR